MYINLNGTGLLLQLAALTGLIALGARLFARRLRQGFVRIRQQDRRPGKQARHSDKGDE